MNKQEPEQHMLLRLFAQDSHLSSKATNKDLNNILRCLLRFQFFPTRHNIYNELFYNTELNEQTCRS